MQYREKNKKERKEEENPGNIFNTGINMGVKHQVNWDRRTMNGALSVHGGGRRDRRRRRLAAARALERERGLNSGQWDLIRLRNVIEDRKGDDKMVT